MKRVLTAVVLIPLVLLLVFRAPAWVMAVALAVVAYFCLSEYFSLLRERGLPGQQRLTVIVVLVALLLPVIRDAWSFVYNDWSPWGLYLSPFTVLLPFLALGPLILLVSSFRMDVHDSLPSAAASYFSTAYIGLSLAFLWAVWSDGGPGRLFVFFVLIVVWVSDISAYIVGRTWGRRKLAPILSPGKTWEGAVASFMAAIAVGTLLWYQMESIYSFLMPHGLLPTTFEGRSLGWTMPPLPRLPFWSILLMTGVINLAAQVGDLAESAIKRGAGAKDSGTLLPGHGGMLDRVDALLGAAPVAFFAYELIVPTRYSVVSVLLR
jgi:phosphatidate cytidylyltransferase